MRTRTKAGAGACEISTIDTPYRTQAKETTMPKTLHTALAAVALLALELATTAASAATIELTEGERGEPNVITFEGEVVTGDELTFVHLVLEAGDGIVIFDSPGGDLWTGLEIGRAIRLMGFDTLVPSGSSCKSACAIAWLGGENRYMAADGAVGFHAAYVEGEAGALETGAGNAVIGAYLYSLGLSFPTINALTSAPPEGMLYLTCDEAKRMGIEVALYEEETPAGGQQAARQ